MHDPLDKQGAFAKVAHTIHAHHHHFGWCRENIPVIHAAPGDTIALECMDASGGQITSNSRAVDLLSYDLGRGNPVTGPVYVDGAEPGDVISLEMLGIEQSGVGWTSIMPNFGLLDDQFPNPALKLWKYEPDEARVAFSDVAQVWLKPFCGTIGAAPAAPGVHSVIPPYPTGGNLDLRDMGAGAKIFLPVEVPGGLISLGDMHAAQGDGEVCGSAIESAMNVVVKVGLEKGMNLSSPRLIGTGRPTGRQVRERITSGISENLLVASRNAVQQMIDWLCQAEKICPEDAYMLCSICGDLRISEIVNRPRHVVTFAMSLDVFD